MGKKNHKYFFDYIAHIYTNCEIIVAEVNYYYIVSIIMESIVNVWLMYVCLLEVLYAKMLKNVILKVQNICNKVCIHLADTIKCYEHKTND